MCISALILEGHLTPMYHFAVPSLALISHLLHHIASENKQNIVTYVTALILVSDIHLAEMSLQCSEMALHFSMYLLLVT